MAETLRDLPRVDVIIRARPALVRAALIAAAIAGLPLFGALYWLSISHGTWLTVAVVQLALLAVLFVGIARYRSAHVMVSNGVVRKQAFFVRSTVPISAIAATLIATTYHGGGTDTVSQLLLTDSDGRRLLRLPGLYWTREDMERVARAIGAPVTIENEAMSLRDFYRLGPGIPYWFENRPWLIGVGVLLGGVVALGAIGLLMHMIGLEVWFSGMFSPVSTV